MWVSRNLALRLKSGFSRRAKEVQSVLWYICIFLRIAPAPKYLTATLG